MYTVILETTVRYSRKIGKCGTCNAALAIFELRYASKCGATSAATVLYGSRYSRYSTVQAKQQTRYRYSYHPKP